jgi:thymidylate synthase ThyX
MAKPNKFTFYKNLHTASLETNCPHHKLKAHALLQDPTQKQPSINAFLGARYSRSADSVVDIAKEVMNKGQDASKRLESIFYGYGHKSVGDMADLFLCLENVPMITAMRIFNTCPVLAGQERSTRFQNFQKPEFIKLPDSVKNQPLKDEYEAILNSHMKNYLDLLEPTRIALMQYFEIDEENKKQVSALTARTFDTVRYFLPLGLQTSLGFVMSARMWSDLIGQLGASKYSIENELGKLVHELLSTPEHSGTDYIPEADGLIRHTENNYSRKESTQAILKILSKEFSGDDDAQISRKLDKNLAVKLGTNQTENLLRHYQLLHHPLSENRKIKLSEKKLKELSQIIFEKHNHHNQLGNVGQSGTVMIEGFADFGVLKDLNRHRSMERFVPMWNDNINLEAELDRDDMHCFFLCNYLHIPELIGLRKEYENRLAASYQRIRDWYQGAKRILGEDMAHEYTTYLLPHAHSTRYKFYGSFDDLQYTIHLRSRNGGHVAYRSATYSWLKKLAKADPIWNGLLEKLPKVDPKSRDQFIDRS